MGGINFLHIFNPSLKSKKMVNRTIFYLLVVLACAAGSYAGCAACIGGNGKWPWSYFNDQWREHNHGKLSKVEVRYGEHLLGISARYGPKEWFDHGVASHGTRDTFELADDEYLNEFKVCKFSVGTSRIGYLSQVIFKTSKGRQFGPYGSATCSSKITGRISGIWLAGTQGDAIHRLCFVKCT